MENIQERALEFHSQLKGKIEVCSKVEVSTAEELSLAYTPGVAEPCKAIAENPDASYKYTSKSNLIVMISDGTAVLGLGDIGPRAAMPVIEGKAVLLKKFAGVDAYPIVLGTKDVNEIVKVIKALEPTFAAIHLEDISAPRCFEIEERLKKELSIPVYHDDQHGSAIVALAALVNALKIVKKDITKIKVVVNGAGAAGIATAKLLLEAGVKNMILVDKMGILCQGEGWMNPSQASMAQITNTEKMRGSLSDAIKGADVFIGVSAPRVLSKEMVSSMNSDAIIFALANPVPEILPNEALEAGARIVGTGGSNYPNQINNVLSFPGVFRGILDVRAKEITEGMKLSAAYAIAEIISEEELSENYIIPGAFDTRVVQNVAKAVAKVAIEEGVAVMLS